jgi:hypothetical protein
MKLEYHCFTFSFSVAVLGVELRTFHWVSMHSTTWITPLALFYFIYFSNGVSCFCPGQPQTSILPPIPINGLLCAWDYRYASLHPTWSLLIKAQILSHGLYFMTQHISIITQDFHTWTVRGNNLAHNGESEGFHFFFLAVCDLMGEKVLSLPWFCTVPDRIQLLIEGLKMYWSPASLPALQQSWLSFPALIYIYLNKSSHHCIDSHGPGDEVSCW